jgi:hypothetical protein
MSTVDIIQHFHFGQLHLSKARKEAVLANGHREWTLAITNFPDYTFWKNQFDALSTQPVSSFWALLKQKLMKLKMYVGHHRGYVFASQDEFEFYIGVAITNPVDQFSKKEGLKIALSRARAVMGKTNVICMDKNTDITIAFTMPGHDHNVRVTLGSGGRTTIQYLGYRGQDLYRLLHGEIKDEQVSNHQG